VESYHLYDGYACVCCSSNLGPNCDVALGAEQLRYCDGFRNDLTRQMGKRHPVDPATFDGSLAEADVSEPELTDDIPF